MYIPCKNNNNKKTNNPPQQAVICTFFSTWTLIPGVDKDFKVPAKQALCLINIQTTLFQEKVGLVNFHRCLFYKKKVDNSRNTQILQRLDCLLPVLENLLSN